MIDPQIICNAIELVKNQKSFIQDFLVDTLHWDIDSETFEIEDTAYEWTADELNAPLVDEKLNGRVLQLAFQTEIPWGVFILEFEHREPFVKSRGLTMPLRQILNSPSSQTAA